MILILKKKFLTNIIKFHKKSQEMETTVNKEADAI